MRPKLLALALLLSLAACTGGSAATVSPAPGGSLFLPSPSATPSAAASPPAPAGPAIVLPVVATTSGPLADEDRPYLDGMRLAVEEIDAARGVGGRPVALEIHDDGGDPDRATELVGEALDDRPAALLYVGPGPALSSLRTRFEQAGTPVILLSGDLYTSRGLFPQVFQTTIPWEWQAHVIARYLVTDRKAKRIVFIGEGPEARAAEEAFRSSIAYWGGKLRGARTGEPSAAFTHDALDQAAGSDSTVVFGSPSQVQQLAEDIQQSVRPTPRVSGPSALLVGGTGQYHPDPGTTACYSYTWAGWAQPIPRVGDFRTAFAAATGRGVTGLEQEGYDAIRLLARSLRKTGLAGGAKLSAQLEATHDLTYSSFPLDFGPDDHLFLPRDELGLFAVAGPDERVDPWELPGTEPWRGVMRTFTYDGQRTNVLDIDRTVFFPFWDKYQPGPNYWRSIYGITSRPKRDPLH